MPTLTRVAVFSGDLGETLKQYDPRFTELRIGSVDILRYGLYVPAPKPSFMMASKERSEKINSEGYNFMLTITSDQDPFNLELANQFMARTHIDLREAPQWLTMSNQSMDFYFRIRRSRDK